MMGIANLFTVSSFSSFFLFPLFITHHGGSKADIGIIMGLFALSAVLCRPWVSDMVDRIGRKRSYTVGCLIMSLLPVTYLLFRGDLSRFYFPLIFIRFVHGVGLAICFTSAFTYIADIVPEDRLNEGIGMFGVTGLTGLAIGPIIAEIVIRSFGFSVFFFTSAAMATLGLLLHLPLPESYVPVSHESSQSFFSVLVKRNVFAVALVAMLFGFGLAASGSFVSPFAKEHHLPFISLYYISYSSSAVTARLLGGRLADRIGEDQIIPYAMVLTGTGLLILIFMGGSTILVLSGFLSGCGHGFLFPCLNSLIIRNQPINIRGKITGIFTGGIDAGAFVGSIILGYIGEWAGFRALFFAAGIVLLAGLGIYKRSLPSVGMTS
ncbi:MAG: MFS transporter [Deltaproteobacteria bacterium CG12_big_fil_rev_8_21_14_0_65_43_10]|nr:MAG: MFS transporter [Deltaproteobacteria bacterium CG2_30_43_15]PIQ46780.1 MAG: MFS transporter [Deltaproteobacteria bacterium CG12_big_fil_rev_8_21_14_0_65_43_10]PIU85617.1 MAG: MFS transporter [Deltaproteobacteria bacterium CG06_land_8_20_14_3_00_44_19]PIX23296.1 MAG: MFS transporter [Deltaproteobacteria bacterium CG_4_8_14_3_um_filter_43_13]PIZ20601.1 MAG: MFS transporter [Deltaproteobacteria bacterium CG_4_10_14_0_8_um_filter_43_12]PJB39538.1 MAG: MFS transporter [Deltaproteobacteria b